MGDLMLVWVKPCRSSRLLLFFRPSFSVFLNNWEPIITSIVNCLRQICLVSHCTISAIRCTGAEHKLYCLLANCHIACILMQREVQPTLGCFRRHYLFSKQCMSWNLNRPTRSLSRHFQFFSSNTKKVLRLQKKFGALTFSRRQFLAKVERQFSCSHIVTFGFQHSNALSASEDTGL